jgi:hypothetical protein
MSKWICIEETCFLTLHHNKTGALFVDSHYVGDIVEVKNNLIYFTDKEDNELYIGSVDEDENNYDGSYHNEPILKEYFITLAEWRDRQIDKILEE